MRSIIIATSVLLIVFASLCITKKGEILAIVPGEIQKCDTLSGGGRQRISHATIRTNDGRYIISPIENCSTGDNIDILVRRGALFFNSIYNTR